jgi:hypothetical protein
MRRDMIDAAGSEQVGKTTVTKIGENVNPDRDQLFQV